jgi:Transposase.
MRHLGAWLQHLGVQEVVMESTAQYWKPVWLALEGTFRLFLAQAWSNRAPRGKKADFKDAERLVRRHLAGELTLSFVPDSEQRLMRSLTRRRAQLTRDRVRIQNQVESLLEEMRIKLSSMVSDLFGASGLRILAALGEGETDPGKLASLADARVQRSREELADALNGTVTDIHRRLLKQHLGTLNLVGTQMAELAELTGEAMREHAEAIARLAQIPGIRVLAAQQFLPRPAPEPAPFPRRRSLAVGSVSVRAGRKAPSRTIAAAALKGTSFCGGYSAKRRRRRPGPGTAFFNANSGACCRGWGIPKPSGRSPGTSAWSFGRSSMKAPTTRNADPSPLHKPSNDVSKGSSKSSGR